MPRRGQGSDWNRTWNHHKHPESTGVSQVLKPGLAVAECMALADTGQS